MKTPTASSANTSQNELTSAKLLTNKFTKSKKNLTTALENALAGIHQMKYSQTQQRSLHFHVETAG